MSSLECISFNLQRRKSDDMFQTIMQLHEDYPGAILCLQEVAREISTKILRELPRGVGEGENIIIGPADIGVKKTTVLDVTENGRTFFMSTFDTDIGDVSVLTGKLQPGGLLRHIRDRSLSLRILLGLEPDNPLILALDTNFAYPFEHDKFYQMLGSHKFGTTSHPDGTHALGRLEETTLGHRVLRLWGQVFQTRTQLDRILFSNHFHLQKSHVRNDIQISDHEPVVAFLRKT